MAGNPQYFSLSLIIGLAFMLTGCDVIVGIFEAGFWTGIVLVILVVLLVVYLWRRGRKR